MADCTAALRLLGLEPAPVRGPGEEGGDGAGALGVRLWARRGAARCRLGDYAGGQADLAAAARHDPSGNRDLRHDLALVSGGPAPPPPDPRQQSLAALDAAGVPRPAGMGAA